MARTLLRTVESPRVCSYLPDETATLEYRILVDVSPPEHEELLARGWRRFGFTYFRPACPSCRQCVSIRVPAATLALSRSQRRATRGLLRCEVGPVRVDAERLALYDSWHANREDHRGWEPAPLDAREYARDFAAPHASARELAYYDDTDPQQPRLVAIGHCDVTPSAWSAIYFFYDPAYAGRSPGVAHVLNLVELARRGGQRHVYLGYWIANCPSMRYKALFRPHELLDSRPLDDEAPLWQFPPSSTLPG